MTLPDLVVCGFDDSPQSLTAARWAADDRIAVLVDSLTVKLLRG